MIKLTFQSTDRETQNESWSVVAPNFILAAAELMKEMWMRYSLPREYAEELFKCLATLCEDGAPDLAEYSDFSCPEMEFSISVEEVT